jgi:hypothetical protein
MSDRQFGPVATILNEGHKYLSDPNHWVQYISIKRERMPGWRFWRTNVRYCATGYIHYNVGLQSETSRRCFECLTLASQELYDGQVPHGVNDLLGHEATLRMYQRATMIAAEKGY